MEVKHSQGPLPRVLFEQTEGHIFWIQYRYTHRIGFLSHSTSSLSISENINSIREGEASSSPAAAGASPAGTSDRRELSLAGAP